MFEVIAPFYDRAMRLLGVDYSAAVDGLALARGDLVLDIGGGTGLGAQAAANSVGCEVLIVDHSAAMLRHGHCGGHIRCVRGDAAHLPLGDTTIDGVLLLDALHHFPQPAAALAEIARVLKPGRRLALLEIDGHHPAVKFVATAERLAGEPGVMWSPKQLVTMLQAAGLTPLDQRVSGFGVLATARRSAGYVESSLLRAQDRE